jgi:hypothetical protein
MLAIDLHAKAVLSSQRVWRLFPGAGYRFLDDFLNSNVGYLDFPGLELPPGPLKDAGDLISRIAMATELKATAGYLDESEASPLSLEDFAAARHTQNRGRLRSALVNLYEIAATGDLVVLPTPLSNRLTWIGEITSNRIFVYSILSPRYTCKSSIQRYKMDT